MVLSSFSRSHRVADVGSIRRAADQASRKVSMLSQSEGEDRRRVSMQSDGDIERPPAPHLKERVTYIDRETDNQAAVHYFPWFYDQDILIEFRIYQTLYFDLIGATPLAVLCLAFMATRFNFENTLKAGAFFEGAFILWLCGFILLGILILFYSISYVTADENYDCLRISASFMKLLDRRLQDLVGILIHLGCGMFLYARVVEGQCPTSYNWLSQTCNPVADSRAVPGEMVFFIFLLPIICQIGFKSLSIQAVFLCWGISFAYVTASVIYLHNDQNTWDEAWTILVGFITPCLCYEYEKVSRKTFMYGKQVTLLSTDMNSRALARQEMNKALMMEQQRNRTEQQKNRRLLAAEESSKAMMMEKARHEFDIAVLRAEEIRQIMEKEHNQETVRLRHEREIVEIHREEERGSMEKEREQMVSLIGNIAHDLKTPLQSFRMDLELLKSGMTSTLKAEGKISMKAPVPRGSFIGSMNGPMNSSMNNAETGGTTHIDPFAILESLDIASIHMTMGINRFIDYAKASGGIALVPSMETFNLSAAFVMPVNCVKHLSTNIEIIINPFPKEMCLFLITDKHWLVENMLGLLSNAAKFSNGGTVNVTVELLKDQISKNFHMELHKSLDIKDDGSEDQGVKEARAAAEKSPMIKITVIDKGIGISKDARKGLFQPFKQAQRMTGGTGLGLYSLSKRVEALGGRRGAEPRKDGEGSAFWFTFPYRPDHLMQSFEVKEEIRKASLKIGVVEKAVKLRILLIDDSTTVQKVTSRALKAKGHHVEVADNGSLGLDKLTTNYDDFDLVLCDLQMPVMDGFEATRRFRKFEDSKFDRKISTSTDVDDGGSVVSTGTGAGTKKFRLPIIGMSANSDSASKECAFTAGMDRFVPKPFTLGELLPIIERMIPRNRDENAETVLPIIDSSRHENIRTLLPVIEAVNSENTSRQVNSDTGRHLEGVRKSPVSSDLSLNSLQPISESRVVQQKDGEVHDIFRSGTSSDEEEKEEVRGGSRTDSGVGVKALLGRTKSETKRTVEEVKRVYDSVRKDNKDGDIENAHPIYPTTHSLSMISQLSHDFPTPSLLDQQAEETTLLDQQEEHGEHNRDKIEEYRQEMSIEEDEEYKGEEKKGRK
mmetsp:Transcript_29043/g.27831  ORF Transcript_29043/g.27831 Transcript_29043/m.27831 type:complete len:1116 (+) Transcript_29043:177-3524(+)